TVYPVFAWRFRPDRTHNLFASLIGTLADAGHDVSILTFNYDISLEAAMDHMNVPYTYCLTNSSVTGQSRTIRLLKLHGSLNWAKCECGQIRPDAPDRAPIPLPIFDLIANNASCPGKKQELFIVPPTCNKMGYYGDIRPVWGEAVDVLRDAENIIVIAYSWPKTDHF